MMAFGIPGDAVTAVMLGALIIHGIQPGPLFATTHSQIAYGMFVAYFLAHFLTVAVEWLGLKLFLRVILVPQRVLIPVILVLCGIGAFALNNIVANVWTFLIFGVIGYGMIKGGVPLAPMVLGVVLGDQLEVNLIRALMTDANLWLFVSRPISGLMLAGAVASVAWALYRRRRSAAAAPAEVEVEF